MTATMKVHALQHAAFEGLAAIAPWLATRNATITTTRFFESPALPPFDGLNLIVILGGPMSVTDETEFPWLRAEKQFIREAVLAGIPVLGVCLGAQLLASALGGKVYRNTQKEIGWFPIEATPADGNQFVFPNELCVFHWHGDTFDLPPGAVRLARSAATPNQAFQVGRRTIALQFHLDATPDSVKAFIDNCGNELRPGTFVQNAQTMLAAPASAYTEINALLDRVLDYLTELKTSA